MTLPRFSLTAPAFGWSFVLLLAGLANTWAFAPYHWHALPLLTLALLTAALLKASSARQAAWFGFSYGLGWFGLGVSWVHVSIATFGGMPLVASLGIMVLLVAYLALFPALAAGLSHRLQTGRTALFPLLLATCWTFSENLRSWLFSGFPWLSVGYSQTDGWLAPYAPLVGETGISFVLVFAASALVCAVLQPGFLASVASRSQLALAVALLALSPLLGMFKGWQPTGDSTAVALVQGNIRQELRWAPEQELPTMKKYMQLTRPVLADRLVIWPEAAIPQLEPDAQAYLFNLDMLASEQNAAVITGILDYKRNGDAYNGMIVVGQTEAGASPYSYQTKNRYQKHHLLPIGEFVPFERFLRDVAPFFDLPNSSFARGDWQQPNLTAKGHQLLAALCFEIAFPRQIAANFSDSTDFLLTVSNDAWFGDSIGPWQHLEIARMRALEFGRPLLRATNTGITAAVGADGQVLAQLPQFQDGVLTFDVPHTQGRTLYSLIGDWPLYLIWLGVALMLVWPLLQRRLPPAGQRPVATTTPQHAATPKASETASAEPAVQPTKTTPPAGKERIEPHF